MIYKIAAFYRFTAISDIQALRESLLSVFSHLGLWGTLLIAPEGINGTLAGNDKAIESMITLLAKEIGLRRDDIKFSEAVEKPFNKLKIRLKRELITFRQPAADPNKLAGTYVEPKDWNELVSQPDVVVLDTRNIYETVIGTFKDAIDPQIQQFTDFPSYVRTKMQTLKQKKIAMYCTGGIRCEKASAFMRAEGFEHVFHLKGGVLKYLEEVPPKQSLWKGECYVFDRRMAVGHGLTTGRYSMCFSCGYALSAHDKEHKHYEPGVSCGYCYDWSTDKDRQRFRARHVQMTPLSASSKDA